MTVKMAFKTMTQDTLPQQQKAPPMTGILPRQYEIVKTKKTQKQLWTELYANYQAELVHYLQSKWFKQKHDANDITQQAFERFMLVAEPERIEKPRAYLYQLVRNLTVDGLRRDKVRYEHARQEAVNEEPASIGSPLNEVLNTEQLEFLQKIIETLPAKRRRAFVLSRVYQMTYAEISDDMGISVEGVKKHVLRALSTCQEHLANRFKGE